MISYFIIAPKHSAIKYHTHEVQLFSANGTLLYAEPINFRDIEARARMMLIRGIPEGAFHA